MSASYTNTRKKVLLGFSVSIAALLFIGFVTLKSANDFIRTDNEGLNHQEILDRLSDIRRAVARAESEERVFVLTGKDEYMDSFSSAHSQLKASCERLKTLIAGDPSEARIGEIEEIGTRRLDDLNEVVATYKSKGPAAAESLIGSRNGFDLMDHFRTLLEGMIARERAKLSQITVQNLANRDTVTKSIAVGIVVAVLSVLGSMLVVIRDARRRMEAERSLHDTLALQNLIFDSVDAAIVAADGDGNVTHFNRAAEKSLGYRAEEVVGKYEIFHKIHDEEERKVAARELSELIGEPVDPEYVFGILPRRGQRYVREWTHIRKDGSRYPARISVSALRGMDGDVVGMVGVSSDLTREKSDREQLDRYIEDLASKNLELELIAVELKESRDLALAATRTKSEFLANMSHEIRTPMNGVIGMAHLLQHTSLNERQQGFVRTILNSADSLLAILNDILDLSKMEAGKMTFEHFPFDLRTSLEDLCESYAPTAHQKGIELFCVIPPDLPDKVIGDAGRIRQILSNLLSNAIKFTQVGEVVLRARLVRSNPARATYRFSIKDTGIGIPSERQDSIFESFTQADGSTTRRFGGTGLGLTISRQLVQLMGGEIGVVSEEGAGSEFWFELTLQRQEGKADDASLRDLGNRRILVVDDNETNRAILREMLTAWHCTVDEAVGGREAVSRARVTTYDCIIVDQHMPGFDGMDTARELKRFEGTSKIPLILLSSSGFDPEEMQKGSLFTYVLFKPVRSSPLYNVLLQVSGGEEAYGRETVEASSVLEPDARLRGVRVLVAEDNTVNQMVATELLEGWGCVWETADNGAAAVAMVENGDYDVVLMDVQMPVMDGLEATTRIREWERESGRHTPIIAMTANAMSGDRERCLKVGMDGYVSKPLRPKALMENLLESIGRESSESATSADGTESSALFEPDRLDETCAGKAALKIRVIERFIATAGKSASEIVAAAAEGDVGRLSAAAHALKGSSLTVGSPALSSLCATVEMGARGGTINAEAVSRIEPVLGSLGEALTAYAESLKANPT